MTVDKVVEPVTSGRSSETVVVVGSVNAKISGETSDQASGSSGESSATNRQGLKEYQEDALSKKATLFGCFTNLDEFRNYHKTITKSTNSHSKNLNHPSRNHEDGAPHRHHRQWNETASGEFL